VATPNGKQVRLDADRASHMSLQLLLFVDERPSSQEYIRNLEKTLQSLPTDFPYELQTIEVGEQPDLAEYFRLVATPSLVKIHPEPRQILTGSDLVGQLQKWWSRWQRQAKEREEEQRKQGYLATTNGVDYSIESIRLADEVFRLKKEKEELLEQLQFKDRVLAMLAHDLRSPLTAASIAIETLEMASDRAANARAARLTEQLYKQARAQLRIMNRMITDILQAAKGNSVQLKLHCHPLSLPSLCDRVLGELTERFESKSLQLHQDIPQDLPQVYADAELIRQVLINLLENAIKYTPPEGQISLSILHRTSQKVQVSVEDTGPGIPEEKQDRIFEDRFRLKRDREKEGYGLGLALCRDVIRAHYGQIWVESGRDRGSCFHFTLPVYR